jgi:membrane protease YdiL (CAAX protease family)
MFSILLPSLFVLFLAVGVPVLSRATARDREVCRVPRLALYFSAAISQYVLAGLGLLVFSFSSLNAHSVGFRTINPERGLVWTCALAALSVGCMFLDHFLERRGWWPAETELVRRMIPETREETLWAVLLMAPTAALCEEFLYRGFLLSQLALWLPGHAWAWAASSLIFGLAHTYQGWGGMARASLLGALLAYPVICLGSLYPSMLAHAMIDALTFAWLGPRFLRQESPAA